jgi:hypothetical protein
VYRFNHSSASNKSPEQKPEDLNQSTTTGGISWKKALAIGAVPLLLLFGAAFQSSNSVPGQLQAIQSQLTAVLSQNSALQEQVASLANKGPRKFYKTKTTHTGAEARDACAEGYHMASLWEIHDPSNLRYDTDLGVTTADSGFGPPSGSGGWIRTGDIAGTSNCFGWTSAVPGDLGTAVVPNAPGPAGWEGIGTRASPWFSGLIQCQAPTRVWCVQD